MNYDEARYNVFWAYGTPNLSDWMSAPDGPQEAIDMLLDGLVVPCDLFTKAVLVAADGNVAATRKARYRRGVSIAALLRGKTHGSMECGVYILDVSFSPVCAPRLLVNLYSSASGKIAGRTLLMPDGTTEAGTFLICGVDWKHSEFSGLVGVGRRVSQRLSLRFACAFENVGYEYDGVTPLEWAYKNHSAMLRSGRLSDLEPSGTGRVVSVD